MKPDCYKCKWRRDLVYDAHSQCVNPKAGGEQYGMVGFASFAAGLPLLGVRGNPHGIKHGWFMWPLNFDPVWLEACEGFTPQTKEGDAIESATQEPNVS